MAGRTRSCGRRACAGELGEEGVRHGREAVGRLRFHKAVGDSGKAVERGFCPACGSPVATKLEKIPDILGLQAGSLDDPSLHRPAMDLFTASAQPWDQMSPETRKLPQGIGG
jgi:hypothetical protein